MDTFSRLDGTLPIAPESGRIWKTQKKHRTGDDKERDNRKNQGNKDEKKDVDIDFQHVDETEYSEKEITDPDQEEAADGTKEQKKHVARKIDVVI